MSVLCAGVWEGGEDLVPLTYSGTLDDHSL